MLKISFVFPKVVPWNILICMPSLSPAKSSAKAHTCHCWGMCMGRGSKWGWDCQNFETSTNQRSTDGIPIGLWAGSLMEFMKQVLKSIALCWVPNCYVWIFTSLRSASPTHLTVSVTWVFCVRWENIEPLSLQPMQLGKPGTHSLHSRFSLWKKSWAEGVCLGAELCCLGGRMTLVNWYFSS